VTTTAAPTRAEARRNALLPSVPPDADAPSAAASQTARPVVQALVSFTAANGKIITAHGVTDVQSGAGRYRITLARPLAPGAVVLPSAEGESMAASTAFSSRQIDGRTFEVAPSHRTSLRNISVAIIGIAE
jgi:hypothetical protein